MCLISAAYKLNSSAIIDVAVPSKGGITKKDDPARLPVSVFIIAKDEAVRLPRCLDALMSWAGEIVLVNSGSTDQTVEIGEAYGARVCHRPWNGFGPQKRFAQQKCRYDWVLNVDADEVVTEDLADEIKALFEKTPPQPDAFRIRILTVYPGKTKPRLWANDYNVVRFYHRSVGSYSDDTVHDRVNIGDHRARQLRAPIYHFTNISVSHAVQKALSFAEFRAATSDGKSAAVLKARLLYEFPLVFVKAYFGRRHFTGGWQGYYYALCLAFMRTTRLALMLERR